MRVRKRPGLVVVFVLVAVAGFGSTLVLGSARGGILPTLTVPTLPVSTPVTTAPLPPAPPVPPAPPPALPPAPPPPARLAPPPPLPPAPPLLGARTAPLSSSAAGAATGGTSGGSSGSSAGSTGAGSAPSSAAQPSSRTAATAPKVSRTRFHTRGPGRRGTTITFRLTAPATVVLLVRGPSPSCDLAGRRVVTLGRGVSRVRFLGRFHGHPLAPGTYGITMVARRGHTNTTLGRLAVDIVPPGQRIERTAARPVYVGCQSGAGSSGSGGSLASSEPFAGLGLVLPTVGVTGAAGPVAPTVSLRPPKLAVAGPNVPQLSEATGGGHSWLGILLYAVLMIAGGAMLLLVLSFATQRWNP